MTIIVAVRDAEENSVLLGSDSQVSMGGDRFFLHEGGPLKIAQNGDYLVGMAGRLRTGQVLMHSSLPALPADIKSGRDIDTFMITEFSKRAQEILAEAGVETIFDAERLMTESELIICVKGMPYTISDDYSVMRGEQITERFMVTVIGSGYSYALGAAYGVLSASENVSQEELVTVMLEAAARWDGGCGAPFYTIKQQG